MNRPEFVGNLTSDPRSISPKVVSFRIAANSTIGQDKVVAFIDCKAFGENVAKVMAKKKGSQIKVAGPMKTEDWTAKDGNKRSSLVLLAFDIDKEEEEKTAAQE